MIEFWMFIFLALALLGSLLGLLLIEKSEKRRLALDSELPPEHRVPRHYRNLSAVEKQLWSAEELKWARTWESARLELRPAELAVVTEYLRGLHEDFQRGSNIFGAVILHCPNIQSLCQLEWQRLRLRASFRIWFVMISLRLKMNSVSVEELRRITDVVTTLAYYVRTMLTALEQAGQSEFVQSVLRRS
jgi:hypothetical protein